MKKRLYQLLAIGLLGYAGGNAIWPVLSQTTGIISNHFIAVGRGPGVIGFGGITPSSSGLVLTSQGLGADPIFSSLTPAFAPQSANTFLAGPISGAPAAPTFRAIDSLDIPSALSLGVSGTTAGSLGLFGATSGKTTISVPAVAGTYNFILPIAAGTSGFSLLSQGAGNAQVYGLLGLAAGGTGSALVASNGGLVYSTGSGLAILAGTATAGQIPLSSANSAPSWSTATYPSTVPANYLLYASSTNVVSSTNIIPSGTTWNGATIGTGFGGTGATSLGAEFTNAGNVLHIVTNSISNAALAQVGAATIKGNPTNATANAQDFTIQGLTARGAPDASNDKIPIYDNAAGTIKYVTPGAIAVAATAGVQSIQGMTSAITCSQGVTCSLQTIRLTNVGEVDPVTYGADKTGVADSTAAWQSAINACRASLQASCAIVPSPGTYRITALDCTNANGLVFRGVGSLTYTTQIHGTSNGATMFDCTGSEGVKFENLAIGNASGAFPRLGIVVAPSVSTTGMDNIVFRDLSIQGMFTGAAMYLDRTGSSKMEKVQVINTYSCTGCYGVIFTGQNTATVSSVFVTTASVGTGTNQSIGTSDWNLYDIDFHTITSSATNLSIPVLMDGTSSFRYVGGNTSCNNNCSMLFRLSDGAVPYSPGLLQFSGFGVYVDEGVAYNSVFGGTGQIQGLTMNAFGLGNLPNSGLVFANTGPVRGGIGGSTPMYLSGVINSGETIYMGPQGYFFNENQAAFYNQQRILIGALRVVAATPPGAGQTFTIRLRRGGSNVPSFIVTISGASQQFGEYVASFLEAAPTTAGNGIDVQVIASAGANSSQINITLDLIPVSSN